MRIFIFLIVTLILFGTIFAQYERKDNVLIMKPNIVTVDTVVDTIKPLNFKDSLFLVMDQYEIHHQDIVYAQAILETGHFKSNLCKKGNLFGLKGRKGYYHFNHWSESVKMYKERIQSKYREGEDYYHFLKRIHYATGEPYNKKVQQIVKKNGKIKQIGD